MKKITAMLVCISVLICPLTVSASYGCESGESTFPFINAITEFADSVSAMIFGIPFTANAVSNKFEENIQESDITRTGKDTAFLKNTVMVAIDEEAGFFDKVTFFKSNNLTVIGWCCTVDMYVVTCSCNTYSKAVEKCQSLCENQIVLYAFPLTADRVTENDEPNDPFSTEGDAAVWNNDNPYGSNWWLEAVEATSAWDYSEYFTPVKLGIVDSGFDTNHEDLQNRITFPSRYRENVNRPKDHGTHVAGIIAAEKNNGVGICGIFPESTLICTNWKPAFAETWVLTFGLISGVTSTVKAGAKVVNLSVGLVNGEGSPSPGKSKLDSEALLSSYIMGSLLHKGYDFIVVQSAGNGTKAGERIEAEGNGYFCAVNELNCYDGFSDVSVDDIINRIIIVGSAGNRYNRIFMQSKFSNVGEAVDICAPGETIYSTIINSEYAYKSGTSMAAPIVTAICGLVWSVNPDFTGDIVKNIVCTSTNCIALANTESKYLGTEKLTEKPMVNAKLSVEKALLMTYGETFFDDSGSSNNTETNLIHC